MQPEGAANRGRFAFAAAALLPKITLNDKTKLSWAILDSGASSHFLLTDAPCVNKKTTSNPISVQIPNGHRVTSSHIAELDIPALPKKARIAHVLPGLRNRSLVSVIKLCNAGCKVDIRDISCTVTVRGHPPIICRKCTETGLWMIPISSEVNHNDVPPPIVNEGIEEESTAYAFHAHDTSSQG